MPVAVYQRRPAFEAVQYLPGTNCAEVAELLGRPPHPPGECDPEGDLSIPPWGGTDTARPGDWLLRGPGGELLLCPQSVFEALYEPV